MKILTSLVLGLIFSGSICAARVNDCYVSIGEINSNPMAYANRTIKVKAYLVSTDHGSYLSDEQNGSGALRATYSQAESHVNTAMALLERMRFAGVGRPFAQIHSAFEGQLTVDKDGARPKFEIYAEIYGVVEN